MFGNENRVRVRARVGGRLMTKQSDALDTDVGKIVKRWQNTGIVTTTRKKARYGDFSHVGSYMESLTKVLDAQSRFETLPARIRSACENDVGVLLEKLADPEELAKLQALGLEEIDTPEKLPDPAPAAQPEADPPVADEPSGEGQ